MSEKIKYPRDIRWKSMHNEEIAAIVGCHPNTVLRHRAEMGKPKAPRKPGSGARPKINEELIDLDKTARWNAEQQGVNSQWMSHRMRELRKKLKISPRR